MKNAVSESKEEMAGISMSKSEILRSAGETNLLVATIIASVTFTAAFTAPGGYESGGINPGLAVLCKQAAFKGFVISNALAFGFSTASILVYMFSASIRMVLSYPDRSKNRTCPSIGSQLYCSIAGSIYNRNVRSGATLFGDC